MQGGTEEWPVGICDCLTYQHNGKCQCAPSFCPMSVCGTCCILGKVQTLQVGEEPKRALGYFMGIGNLGQAVCIASLPFKFCEPLGGCVWFMLNAFRLRKQVADKYNLRYWTPCCLGAGVELPMGVAACLYPCTYWQLYMTLLAKEDGKTTKPIDTTPTA